MTGIFRVKKNDNQYLKYHSCHSYDSLDSDSLVNSARELRFRLDARFPIREEDCDDDDYLKLGLPFNPKKHPGVVNRKTVSLPEDLGEFFCAGGFFKGCRCPWPLTFVKVS
jgi:hypothetical protein